MGTADKIRELIEQTATIKANFHLENSLSFSSYDWRKREKKINYMQVEKINDDPEFMRWRDELVLSLAQLKKDDYIDEHDHSAYSQKNSFALKNNLCSKLNHTEVS